MFLSLARFVCLATLLISSAQVISFAHLLCSSRLPSSCVPFTCSSRLPSSSHLLISFAHLLFPSRMFLRPLVVQHLCAALVVHSSALRAPHLWCSPSAV